MADRYDVGIYGLWYGRNYGSIITYFALNSVVRSLGYSTVMIKNPLGKEGIDFSKLPQSHPLVFANKHYNVTPLFKLDAMDGLNKICDRFLLGSDQMWLYSLSRPYKQTYFFDFVEEHKIKVAYATSFGRETYTGPEEEKLITKKNLQRFNAICLRDDFSKQILSHEFGISAETMIDPVFLCETEEYVKLIESVNLDIQTPFIFAYILDPNPRICEVLRTIINETKRKVVVIFNELNDFAEHPEKLKEIFDVEECRFIFLTKASVEEWLWCFKNAEFVVTDSFHGTCLSIIFDKAFVVKKNNGRGGRRFEFLLETLNLKDNMAISEEEIFPIFTMKYKDKSPKYINAREILQKLKRDGINWLRSALAGKQELVITSKYNENDVKKIAKANSSVLQQNRDFINIRLLVTLLRDYNIKHIVLSPGGRDVPIVRMFEYNESSFILHRVTDERSAAYYGMGIAVQLRQPVACVCTSGTAASNYLPAVTEAYYTGIPLILITADRYSVYLNHGEDQTIPQNSIYKDVVKMEITLPESTGWRSDYQARRDISACILETTNGVFGPVHINIPVDNIAIGANSPKEYWKLLPFIYPHILRASFHDGTQDMLRWVSSLKKSDRILIVYGQNVPLTDRQRENIESFASKYNCVIVTDPISNLNSKYSLMPHNMLQAISQSEFNAELSPDILITVGGKRLMNDPLTNKIRHGLGNIRHWSVTPDGKIKDFYFHLTSVIESTQDNFFKWFAENAGDIRNNGVYYEKWRVLTDRYRSPEIEKFNSLYIQSKFLPAIPQNSMLHLGVGQSFIECRRFNIDSSVEVYCNMGTNGIDGCTSTFMGQCAVVNDKLCFLLVGDLSFFYDMNSIWNKPLKSNIRILMVNNNGTGLLRGHNLRAVSSVHNTAAEGWVRSTGFEYISAHSKDEFDEKLKYFISDKPKKALFFEVFCE